MKTRNHELLKKYLKDNHLKNSYLSEKLDKTETWVSRLLNGHITVTSLADADKINEITDNYVPVVGW